MSVETRMMPCSKCKRPVEVGEQTTAVLCDKCTMEEYDAYVDEIHKGQKEVYTMAKEKITDVRVANAKKVLELIDTFNVESKEVTKILSRAYSIHKHK